MTTTDRPLTAEERAAVEEFALGASGGGCAASVLLLGGAAAGLTGAALVGLALEALGVAGWGIPVLLAGAAGGLTLGVRALRAHRALDHAQREVYLRDLDAGEARVTVYEVRDAVRLEEHDGALCSWFLDVGDGRLLYLFEPEPTGAGPAPFPCRVVEVARAVRSGLVVSLRSRGEVLPAKPPPAGLGEAGLLPADGEEFAGSLATLPDDLARLGRP
jgi:hypothetical protein